MAAREGAAAAGEGINDARDAGKAAGGGGAKVGPAAGGEEIDDVSMTGKVENMKLKA